MKQIILDVLEDSSQGQINLASEAARETIANSIMAAIKSEGWFLDLGSIDKNRSAEECAEYYVSDEEKERAKWVCEICGQSTYEVDFDYIGSEYNHLGCELKSQEEIDEYIEDIDEQAYAQGRGSSKTGR